MAEGNTEQKFAEAGGQHPEPSWASDAGPSSMPSVDDQDSPDDTNSVIDGLSHMSTTSSLRSSMYEKVEENGRTYHHYRQGKYIMPNDEQEQERLDLQHYLLGMALRSLHLAPIGPNPQSVLDLGTGTGTWAVEFAEQYPSAQVLGTDLSAIQPLNIPANCRFMVDDAEDEWLFNEPFDYIHGRALLSCFKDPKSIFQKAFNALTPGGYFEMQDAIFPLGSIGDIPPESAILKWMQAIDEGSTKLGRPWRNVQHYEQWFKEVGFEDVTKKEYYFPLSAWAKGKYYKELSVYTQRNLLNGIEGMSLKIMGAMGWSAEEVREFLPAVKEDIKNKKLHLYIPFIVVYGRKPVV